MPAGRPEIPFDQSLADEICERISTSNKSLPTVIKEICKEGDYDLSVATIFRWLRDNEGFCNQYAKAKETQADFLAEEIIEIADDSSLDMAFTEEGKPYVDREHINRSRLRVDARKWVASKLKPKKYGDYQRHDIDAKVEVVDHAERLQAAKEKAKKLKA